MKKNIFLKGLTLAFVALVSFFATSCNEEELSIGGVEIPELAEPVASLAMTVLDFENGEVLKYEVIDISEYINNTYTAKCPVIEGYTKAKDINVAVPNISKGQAVVIPVTFYVVPLGSALQDAIDSLGGELPVDPEAEVIENVVEVSASGSLPIENGVITNTSEVAVEMELTIPYKSGYEYRGTNSRSITVEDLMRLKPETKVHKMTITVLPQTEVTINCTQTKTPVIVTIDDVEHGLWYYGDIELKTTQESIGHGHGHGHGGSSNAGGGTGDAD